MKTRRLWAAVAILMAVSASFIAWHLAARAPAEGVSGDMPPTKPASLDRRAAAPHATAHPAPVSSSASLPPSRPERLAFGEQEDMWRFATQAEASRDVALKYEGYIAARECRGLFFSRESNNERVDEALRAGDPAPYMALAALNKRCAGLFAAGPEESRRLVQSLKAQLLASGSSLTPLVEERPMNEQERQAALLSGSPAAIEMVLPHVEGLHGAAVMLAMCDLGRACGADSYPAQLLCVLSGVCGQALWSDSVDQYDSAEWQEVQRDREYLVRAVKAGEVQALFKPR